MRSLRGRLVAILLLVAAAGLLVLAAVTFAEQRAFLYQRLDRQVQAGFIATVSGLRLAAQTGNANCVRSERATEENSGKDVLGNGASTIVDSQWTKLTRSTAGRGPFSLPAGSYGAIVDSSGKIISDCVFGYAKLKNYTPPRFAANQLSERSQTVSSIAADGGRFRAAELREPGTNFSVIVAIPLTETQQTLDRLILVEVTVILLVLALLGVSSWLLVGIGLRPLDRIGNTADAIAGGDLTQRVDPTDPRTEIGRLGIALNHMLHSLEHAFKQRAASERRLRQFLADASHELRTPLAAIRGYAELYRLGATPDREEISRSMERIELEAERMGVLVDDLLTLARLDETQVRDFANVDVASVVVDAVRDAEVAAPDREFTLTADGEQLVYGDAYQLRQVIANLLSNAIAHTPAGSPVDVTVRRDGGEVCIAVRDRGPGFPAGAGEQIFERFWRAEGGRERGNAGSGLGLSIIAEIVSAHGGRVRADAAADAEGGAVVRVWLPEVERAARSVAD